MVIAWGPCWIAQTEWMSSLMLGRGRGCEDVLRGAGMVAGRDQGQGGSERAISSN
jgi:hypothetical protein